MLLTLRRLALACGLLAVTLGSALGKPSYEVWAIDQSNSPGKTYGGTLLIYDGAELERGHSTANLTAEKVDLGGAAAALLFLPFAPFLPLRFFILAFSSSLRFSAASLRSARSLISYERMRA